MNKATPNRSGVTWSPSRTGKIQIAVGPAGTYLVGRGFVPSPRGDWNVWGLYTGTHDLAPISRNFKNEAAARSYANRVWSTR
jgi:hypothetical protein